MIDFRGGESVSGGEHVPLIDLIEQAPGYAGQRITDVTVSADSRNRRHGGYVQLLDENRRLISEDTLSDGYASLPIYERYQRPAYLYFENDVYLNRIELSTEGRSRGFEQDQRRDGRAQRQEEVFAQDQRRDRRAQRQEEVFVPNRALEIGNFVKTNYKAEVKKFSFASGGFSKINFRVQIGEKYAVIVNSIVVLSGGNKRGWKTVGARLSNGDNVFALDVPQDATDIQVSFAHGQGSSVQIILLP